MPKILTIFFSLCLLTMSQAATVVTTGLHGKLKETMETLMKPRLEFINQRSATDWRADDAAFFLKALLIKRGYADSSVEWELPGNNVILLKARLGTQFTIGRVYTNNSGLISAEKLDDYFCQPVIDRELTKRDRAPFLDEYPAEGAANVENFLKSEGYWNAKVSVANIRKNSNGKVDIRLQIYRGKMHQILPPLFKGVSAEHRQQLYLKYKSIIGKPANTVNITELNQAVHQFYREHGFQFAAINVTTNNKSSPTPGKSGVQLIFNIKAGNVYRVRKIYVRGYHRTRASRFNRYVEPLRDRVFNEQKANEVAKKLLLTGAFEIVKFTPEKVSQNELDLVLEVKETKSRFVRAYAGLATFDGFILGASYTDQNFLKKLQIFSAKTEISKRGLLGEISLTEPYFAGENISQTTRLYALQRRYDGYKKSLTGVEASFTWKPTNYYTAKLSGALDYAQLDSGFLTPTELGPNEYLNSRITLEQTFDLRDNAILPTKGFHARSLLEHGAINGDASNNYFRTDLNTSYRYPLEKNRRLVLRFNAGAIFPAESSDLPIDLRLFSGGAESVRSFGERELGPLSGSGDPLGGEAYWNATAEYIHPFNDLFSGVLFFDTGQVFPEANDFSFSNPSYGAGLGLRVDLPVGPARFEYGFNLNQKPGEPSGAFHFSIGAQF